MLEYLDRVGEEKRKHKFGDIIRREATDLDELEAKVKTCGEAVLEGISAEDPWVRLIDYYSFSNAFYSFL